MIFPSRQRYVQASKTKTFLKLKLISIFKQQRAQKLFKPAQHAEVKQLLKSPSTPV